MQNPLFPSPANRMRGMRIIAGIKAFESQQSSIACHHTSPISPPNINMPKKVGTKKEKAEKPVGEKVEKVIIFTHTFTVLNRFSTLAAYYMFVLF
jgi:hypothetical protein